MLACNVTDRQLPDKTPNYHETTTKFPQTMFTTQSIKKHPLNVPTTNQFSSNYAQITGLSEMLTVSSQY